MEKVLLVDDDPGVLAGLKRSFRKWPYEILCASSAEEALSLMEGASVGVVVTDQQMPGLSGLELLKRVRSLYPDTIRFVLTGRATLTIALQAINEGGVSRFFLKPCNPVELAIAIQQELEKRDLMIASRRLLGKVKRQSALMEDLERRYPDISKMRLDQDGAILIDDFAAGDISELMQEICRQLESS